jgi:type VI secretion system secreted protein VgrG
LFELEVVSIQDSVDIEKIMGAEAKIVFRDQETTFRSVSGLVMEVTRGTTTETGYRSYTLQLVPRLMRLTLVHNVQVFVDTTALDVIKKKLTLFRFEEGTDFVFRIDGTLPTRNIIVQYRETDFNFLSRLLEQYGLVYFFEHDAGTDRLVITDNAPGFSSLDNGDAVPYRARGERQDVFELRYRRKLIPKTYVCRDYNYRHPNMKMQSERVSLSSGDLGGVFDYGVHFTTVDEGTALATANAERHQSNRDVYLGQSALPRLSPGHRFTIADHPDDNPPLNIVAVTHHLKQPVQGIESSEATAYSNQFEAIPSERMYRAPIDTPVPRINGLVHAVVQTDAVGSVGKVAQLDDDGRYLVKFRFDASATESGQAASCRVRLMQQSAGPGYGTHFPLHPGIEVLVAFIDGNPDRPIIVGAAPNPVTPSPIGASTSAKNRIRTSSGALIEIDDGS